VKMKASMILWAPEEKGQALANLLEKTLGEIAIAFERNLTVRIQRQQPESFEAASLLLGAIAPEGAKREECSFLGSMGTSMLKSDVCAHGVITYPLGISNESPAPIMETERVLRALPDLGYLVVEDEQLGGQLCFLAAKLSGALDTCYNRLQYDEGKLWSVSVPKENEVSPYGAYRAAADILRSCFSLENEAQCLETILQNVWDAGWRTAGVPMEQGEVISVQDLCAMIDEQVQLVGALMN
jgi:hypothetical protein